MGTAGPRRSIVKPIAKLVVERPWRMLIAGLLVFFALAPGIGRLYQDISYRIWWEEDDPKLKVLDAFEERFGSDVASQLVIRSPSGLFDKESAELIIELTDRMWKTARTMRVESLSNFSWAHAEGEELVVEPLIPYDEELTEEFLAERREVALNHEQLPGFLVSPDGKTTVIYGWLEPGSDNVTSKHFIDNWNDLKELAKEFDGQGDHEVHVAGFPAMEAYMEVEPPKEMEQLTPLILLTAILLLVVFFRRPAAAFLPLLLIIPSVLTTLAFAGWAEFGIDPMSVTAPSILVIIGMSSAVHVLFHYFRSLRRGVARRPAARHALEHTLRPNFLACLTTGLGFLSLMMMAFPPIRDLGLLVAFGTMVVWLYICLFLGPLMVLLPIKSKKTKEGEEASEEQLAEPNERAERLTSWLDRYKFAIVGGWAALVALSLVLAAQNKVSFDPIEWFDPRTELRPALDLLEKEMGMSETFEIVIDSGEKEGIKDPEFLKKVDELGQWMKAKEGITQVTSLVDILKETHRALFGGDEERYRLPDNRRAVADMYTFYTLNLPQGKNLNDRVTLSNDALRMTVISRLQNSPAVVEMADAIRAKAEELGLDVKVTGRSLLNHQLNPQVVPSFARSIITAMALIAIVLLLFFRSVRLGLLSVFTNMIPLIVGAGVIFYLLGKSFDMATIAAFAVALGVAVDDTVHFLNGYNMLRREGYAPRESISRLWVSVGPAMLITSVVLACCFGLYLTITFPVIRTTGVLIGSILVVAFLVDVMLVPALLLLWSGKKKKS